MGARWIVVKLPTRGEIQPHISFSRATLRQWASVNSRCDFTHLGSGAQHQCIQNKVGSSTKSKMCKRKGSLWSITPSKKKNAEKQKVRLCPTTVSRFPNFYENGTVLHLYVNHEQKAARCSIWFYACFAFLMDVICATERDRLVKWFLIAAAADSIACWYAKHKGNRGIHGQ